MKKLIKAKNPPKKIFASSIEDSRFVLAPPDILTLLTHIDELRDYPIEMTEGDGLAQLLVGESAYEIR